MVVLVDRVFVMVVAKCFWHGGDSLYRGGSCNSCELTENIPNCAYYPQLGISNPELVILYQIGDWGSMSVVTQSQRTNHQSPIG